MRNDSVRQVKTRMVHVHLPEELHKRLRIRAAESDTTHQDWVVAVLQGELNRQEKEKRSI